MHSKSRGEACSYLAAPNIAVGFKKECSTVLHWPALVLYYNIARALHNTMRALPAFGACGYSNADPLLDGWRANLQATTVLCSIVVSVHAVPYIPYRAARNGVNLWFPRFWGIRFQMRHCVIQHTRNEIVSAVLFCTALPQYSTASLYKGMSCILCCLLSCDIVQSIQYCALSISAASALPCTLRLSPEVGLLR